MDKRFTTENPETPVTGKGTARMLSRILLGPLIQKALCTITELGIPDLLGEGARTAEQLGAKTGVNAFALYRVLRALALEGVVMWNGKNEFELTPLSDQLRKDHPYSLRDYVLFVGYPWMGSAWNEMMFTIQTGEPAQEKVFGKPVFEYLREHHNIAEIFNRGLSSLTSGTLPEIMEAYDFSGVNTVADIGGGTGSLLTAILKSYPALKGILFETPSVVEKATKGFAQEDLHQRVQLISGDFFTSVPPGVDIYILKFVIHDWNDEDSIIILKNIAGAMNRNSKLLILESVFKEEDKGDITCLRDLNMLCVTGGKERTYGEYRELLEKAGLKLKRLLPTQSVLDIIECTV